MLIRFRIKNGFGLLGQMASGIKESETENADFQIRNSRSRKTKLIKDMAHGAIITDNVLSPNQHCAKLKIRHEINKTDLVD